MGVVIGLNESGVVVEVATCPDADDYIKHIPLGATGRTSLIIQLTGAMTKRAFSVSNNRSVEIGGKELVYEHNARDVGKGHMRSSRPPHCNVSNAWHLRFCAQKFLKFGPSVRFSFTHVSSFERFKPVGPLSVQAGLHRMGGFVAEPL